MNQESNEGAKQYTSQTAQKILFVINKGSGRKKKVDWQALILGYFKELPCCVEFLALPCDDAKKKLDKLAAEFRPDKVVAVGGDGTVTFVAQALMNKKTEMGILPAGSANGMAKELGIPEDPEKALTIIHQGSTKKTDVIAINDDRICLHLSDVGLNAQLIRYFEQGPVRGMLGYALALIKALVRRRRQHVSIETKEKTVDRMALMVIIANASKYGTGATINPHGDPHDGIFEVVIVREFSIIEFIKLFLNFKRFDPKYIEVFGATSALVETRRHAHFQVDGEYLGKVTRVKAKIVPGALNLIMPAGER